MLSHMSTSRNATLKAIASAFIIALALALLPVGSAAAEGDSGRANVTVSDLSLTKIDRSGEPVEGSLSLWSSARLSFYWAGDPEAGKSFTIGLGDHFAALGDGETKPLTVNVDGAPTEIGSCTLTSRDVTCTFSDTVTALKERRFTNFRGTGHAFLTAAQTTDRDSVTMSVNGVITAVPLPAGSGIVGPQESQWTLAKWGSNPYRSASRVDWGIDFGANETTGAKLGKTFDGSQQTITFTDILGDGMRFITDEPSTTTWIRRVGGADQTLASAAAAGEFSVTATYGDDGHTATYTVTGPFKSGENYQLRYPVRFANADGSDAKAVVGGQYYNNVTIDGGLMKDGACVVVQRGFGVDADANRKPEPTPTPEPTPSQPAPSQPAPSEVLARTGIGVTAAALVAGLMIGIGAYLRRTRIR